MRRIVKFTAAGFAAAALALAAMVATGLAEAVSAPIERRADLAVAGIAPGSPPYRVALLSDIHLGNRAMRVERLERIVSAVNAAGPDLVVLAGDFVNGHRGRIETRPQDLIAPLARLRARDGVIATLGNHEHWTDPDAVAAALKAAGITVLSNRAARRGPLLILGVDDGFSRHADIPATLASARGLGGAPVVVTHSPNIAPQLPAGVSLVLAGHTHCGQVVLPVIGSLARFVKGHVYDRHYQCGIVNDPGRTVVVTGGVGSGSVPLRIGAPPDWWLLTLRPPQPARTGVTP